MLAPARKGSLVGCEGEETEERGRTVDEAEEVDQGDGRENVPVDLAGGKARNRSAKEEEEPSKCPTILRASRLASGKSNHDVPAASMSP
jgi:hypothetical protein